MNDVNMTPKRYEAWVAEIVSLCLTKAHPKAYVIFCHTDRKLEGTWFSKSTLVTNAARNAGVPLRWHKIVIRSHSVDMLRPTYSHLQCFSRLAGPGKGTLDVIDGGRSIYRHGTPVGAVRYVFDFLKTFGHASIRSVVDPFVGRGTTLAFADSYGFDSVGVDIVKTQCEYAKTLTYQDMKAYFKHSPKKRSRK